MGIFKPYVGHSRNHGKVFVMRFSLFLMALLFSSQNAHAAGVSKKDVTDFLKQHVAVARSCNMAKIKNHVTTYLTPDYTMQKTNKDGSSQKLSRNDFIQRYALMLSSPDLASSMKAMCNSYTLSLGKVNLSGDNVTFIATEKSSSGTLTCQSKGIKSGTKFMVKQSVCKQQ